MEILVKRLLFAVCVALSIAGCGGGSGSGIELTAAVPSAEALKAKPPAPDPTLVAQPVSMANTTTAGAQFFGTINALADGGYSVGWVSQTTGPTPIDTSAVQRYDSSGAKVGGEVSVPLFGSMAVLSSGNFVVAAASGVVSPTRTVRLAIQFQLFDANGVLLRQTLVANGDVINNPARPTFVRDPQVVALAGGGFVVGWVRIATTSVGIQNQILTQRYDSNGLPVGAPASFASVNAPNEDFLSFNLAADAQGGYTVTSSQPNVALGSGQLRSVFHVDANGTATQIVAPTPANVLLLPLEGDRFALFTNDTSGTTAPGVFRQFLDSAGNPVGSSVAIPVFPLAAKELVDGSFVVFWNVGSTSNAQRFDSSGAAIGNLLTLGSNGSVPGIAPLAGGGFAAAWPAGSFTDPDIFTQRFIEVLSPDQAALRAKRKACLDSAKGMTGQQRKTFVDACLAA
jgi:hypothetical protein